MIKKKWFITPLLLSTTLILGACGGISEELINKVEVGVTHISNLQTESDKLVAENGVSYYTRYKDAEEVEWKILKKTESASCEANSKKEEDICEIYMNFIEASDELSKIRIINYETNHEYMMEELEVLAVVNETRAELQAIIKDNR